MLDDDAKARQQSMEVIALITKVFIESGDSGLGATG